MRKWPWLTGVVLAAVTTGLGYAATRTVQEVPPVETDVPDVDPRPLGLFGEGPEILANLPGVPVGQGTSVGAPGVFDELAVYPVYGPDRPDTPEMAPLHVALEQGHAMVRELPSKEVNRLRFRNDGPMPALGLGGTVFSGGEQDRMTAHDVVLPPGEEHRLGVYCVELNRWNRTRGDVDTKGRFGTMATLAGVDVRGTAQLLANQSEVWKMVDAINTAHCETAGGAPLATTLEDPRKDTVRQGLAARVERFLDEVEAAEHLVGFAVAVNGRLRGARVFASQELYASFRPLLARSAAFEVAMQKVITAPEGWTRTPERPAPAQVAAFMRDLEANPEYVEDVKAGPVGETRMLLSQRGIGSVTSWRAPDGRSIPLTASYAAHPERPERAKSCRL